MLILWRQGRNPAHISLTTQLPTEVGCHDFLSPQHLSFCTLLVASSSTGVSFSCSTNANFSFNSLLFPPTSIASLSLPTCHDAPRRTSNPWDASSDEGDEEHDPPDAMTFLVMARCSPCLQRRKQHATLAFRLPRIVRPWRGHVSSGCSATLFTLRSSSQLSAIANEGR